MSSTNKDEFWGKKPAPSSSEPGEAQGGVGFWKQSEDAHLNKRDASVREAAGGGPGRKKPRWGRRILIALLVLLAGVGVLIALAPTIASSLAPGIIASKGSQLTTGAVSVDSTSFGWGGPQRITGLKVTDKDKKLVASVKTIEVSAGLLGLVMGNLDVGTVTVSGAVAEVVKGQDGRTNLEKLAPPASVAKPASATKGDTAVLPDGLKATVVIKNLNASFTDETAKGSDNKPLAVALNNFDATAKIGAGESLKLEAAGQAGQPGIVTAANKTGSISINATIDRWTDKKGKLTLDKAVMDIKADVKSLPIALLDAFVGSKLQGGSLREGLGDLADLTISANGDLSSGGAELALTSPNASLTGNLKLANNTITSENPIRITFKGAGLPGLSPAVRQTLADQKNASIESLPDATITIDQLKLRIPNDNSPPDFRSSGAVVTVNLTETRGRVALAEGQPQRPFRIAPLAATIAAADLAQPVKITASTTAEIDGQPAGTLAADLSAAGLLDGKGGFIGGIPADLKGDVSLRGVAMAIAQPFVQAMNLDLPSDIGPTLDAGVKLATVSGGPSSAAPPLDVDITVGSQHLNVSGAVRYAKDMVRTRGDGITVNAARAATMAGRFLAPDARFRIWRSKPDVKGLTLRITSLEAPMLPGGQPDMKKLTGDIDISLEGAALVPVVNGKPETSKSLVAESLNIKALLTPGGGLKSNILGKMWSEVAFFDVVGNLTALDLLTNGKDGAPGVALDTMKPDGTIELRNVPVNVARLAGASPAADGTPPLDLVKLLGGVAGPTFTIAASAKGAAQGSYDVTAQVRSDRVMADVVASGSAKQLDLKTLTAGAAIAPETVRGLMETFAPTVTGVPQLAAPSRLLINVDPISIPFGQDGKADFTRVGRASLKVALPGKTLVNGLTATNADGTVRDLGQFGLENFELTATAPVAAIMGPALPNERAISAKLSGAILGNGGQTIGLLNGDLGSEVSDKQLAGPLTAKIDITRIDVEALERIIGKNGMVSGAIGSPASAAIRANVVPPAGAPRGAAFDFAAATTNVEATLEAPKFRSDGPLSASMTPGAVRLTKPSRFTLDATPAWINSFLAPPPPPASALPVGAKPQPPALTIREIAPISLTLESLTLPRAGPQNAAGAPLETALSLQIPRLAAITADQTPLQMSNFAFNVKSESPGPSGTPVAFTCAIAETAVGDKPPVPGLSIRGVIDGLVASDGSFNPENATLSTQGELPNVNTALIDAVSTRDGTLVDALGPTTQAKFNIERYPFSGQPRPGTAPPVIDFQARSQRVSASLRGTIRDRMYIGEQPLKADVTEVTREMSARIIKMLPLLGEFEKRPTDAPAKLDITSITASLDNDLSKLNADVVFTPGEASFATSGFFNEVLKVVQARESGRLGRRLQPFHATVRSGVATYPRWTLPLGEFDVVTEGTVDLVNRRVDVITYVPFGALTDNAVGRLNLGAGSAVTRLLPGAITALTEVPFRTRGPMDNPTTALDPELLAKNVVKKVNPENIIKDTLGDLLKPKNQPK